MIQYITLQKLTLFSVLGQRLDSFAELIASSIEYAESTSHQLQPSKRGPLNVTLLKRIRDITKNIRDMQAWKASGAKNTKSMQ